MKHNLFVASALVIASLGFTTGSANAGGANALGLYTSDCQTLNNCQPSLNGKGIGNATGRPAAGSVGNADGKTPPGQAKKLDGNFNYPIPDGDSGYECDSNAGIGMGNPAHSGCLEFN